MLLQLLLIWECLDCCVQFWALSLGKDTIKHFEMDSEAVNELVGSFESMSCLLLEPWMLNLGKQILWVDMFTSFKHQTRFCPLSTKLCTWMKSSRNANTPQHVAYVYGAKMDFVKCPEDSKRSCERPLMWFSAYCHVTAYLSGPFCTHLLDCILGTVLSWQYWGGFHLSLSLLFVFLLKAF